MPLTIDQKKVVVKEISDIASIALSVVVANYRGLIVSEMTDFRAKARENGVYLRVVPNTLAKRAIKGTEFACLTEILSGPNILAFSKEEPGAAARLFKDFLVEGHENLEVKALAINGSLLSVNELNTLAKLPLRDEAMAFLISLMKAPINKFVRVVGEPHAKLVRTIAAIRNKKQAA